MEIITTLDNKKLSTEEVFSSTEFFLNLLLSPAKRDKLTINISFDNEDGIPGWKASCLRRSNKKYDIWIRKSQSAKAQLVSLAHELVHVKQFVLKEICPITLSAKSGAHLKIQSQDEYWDNPMEIEAFGRAEGLVHRFYQQQNKGK